MRALAILTGLLVVVGGLNWGLAAIAEFDLVAEIFGEEFGTTNVGSRIIYGLVGVAAILHLPLLLMALRDHEERQHTALGRPAQHQA